MVDFVWQWGGGSGGALEWGGGCVIVAAITIRGRLLQ